MCQQPIREKVRRLRNSHEVHEDDVEESRHDQHEEELPGDPLEGNWSGDEDDQAGKVETLRIEGSKG